MKIQFRILFACAFGALIGGATALYLLGQYFWVGSMIGGVVGYMSFDFKEVIEATKNSAAKLRDELIPELREYVEWMSPELRSWRSFLFASITTLIGCLWLLSLPLSGIVGVYAVLGFVVLALSALAMFLLLIMCVALTLDRHTDFRSEEVSELVPAADRFVNFVRSKWFLLLYNPITVFLILPPVLAFTVVCALIVLSAYLVWKGWNLPYKSVGYSVGRFFKRIFVDIHSDARLICAVDAALGSAFGWYFGSALIGMAIGGVLGVVHYEIVSKRILKVVPQAK